MNHFHAAGGLGFLIGELLEAGLLHEDVRTVAGDGLHRYAQEPKLDADGDLYWTDVTRKSRTTRFCVRPPTRSSRRVGLKTPAGNLGSAIIKISAVKPAQQ